MKRIIPLLFIFTAPLILSSCVKNEYYTTTPAQPVGYQNIFDDNFDYDAHNWSFDDAGNKASVDIAQGTLRYSYLPTTDGTNTVAVNTGMSTRKDFLIQTKIRSNYEMGLAFGVSNTDYGYSFFIDDKGYFAVYKEGNASTPVKTIIDWQYNAAIVSGWNVVEFEQHSDYWTGYINGKKVFEIAAQPIYGTKVGFEVMSGTTGYADYLTVQW